MIKQFWEVFLITIGMCYNGESEQQRVVIDDQFCRMVNQVLQQGLGYSIQELSVSRRLVFLAVNIVIYSLKIIFVHKTKKFLTDTSK